MKFKLDENVHGDVEVALRDHGHDVMTVHGQNLAGKPDIEVASAVKAEGRCLITFDLDFSNPRKFPPEEFSGLIVMWLRVPTSRLQVERLLQFLDTNSELIGKLWIVEETQARDWTP